MSTEFIEEVARLVKTDEEGLDEWITAGDVEGRTALDVAREWDELTTHREVFVWVESLASGDPQLDREHEITLTIKNCGGCGEPHNFLSDLKEHTGEEYDGWAVVDYCPVCREVKGKLEDTFWLDLEYMAYRLRQRWHVE